MIPVNKNGHVYMWTFTFPVSTGLEVANKTWGKFRRAMEQRRKRSSKPVMQGLIVPELHPGGHGWHFHILTAQWWDVNEIRGMWRQCGGGRIHVKFIPADRVGYVAIYLRKSRRVAAHKGKRMWRTFGGFKGCKVSEVIIDSPFTRVYGTLKAVLPCFASLKWYLREMMVQNVLHFRPFWWATHLRPSALEETAINANLQTAWA